MKRQSKSAQKLRKNARSASGGRNRKPGGSKTYGKNKSPPISIPNSISDSSSATPIGVCAKNLLLDFDLGIAEKRAEFCRKINEIFRPNKREATTFANIALHLATQVQDGKADLDVFDRAIDWARKARKSRVANKKGLFVAKIKEETGFKAQKKLL